jgi:aminocarboxymuconate-semialdehyde decarboxylase
MNERGAVAIDIHTHVVPEHFPAYAGHRPDAAWPSMAPAHACHRHVMLSGKVYRTVPEQAWSLERRTAEMERLRVGRQVLSPMPELLSYWLDGADGAALSRFVNEQIAEMVAREPARFFGLGAVPLQDVDRAVAELEHVMGPLGLAGVEIGTNIDGIVLGDPRLEPFFAAAERLGAAIFVHPLRPAGMNRLVGPPLLQQVLAFPGETGLAAASLITSGTLARHPRLRIALSHGGGTLAALLPRLRHGWRTFPALRDSLAADPLETARRFWVDSLVYDDNSIRQLLERFGRTQVTVGSDFPFAIADADPIGRIRGLGLDADTEALLLWGNALRWLGQEARERSVPHAHR